MELSIVNLSKTYENGVRALDNVSLTIPAGMFGLLGPNGAGKSTLMRTLATLQEVDSGRAMLGDVNILKQKEVVRHLLGYLPQEFGVYPRTSVQDMLSHIALLKGITKARERRHVVESMLQRCNLYESRKKVLTSLSGGMRQRVMIAAALITRPALLIADEPTTALDVTVQAQILELIRKMQRDLGTAVIFITHDIGIVSGFCDRVLVMYAGRIVESATTSRTFYEPKHPYNQALQKSIPALHEKGETLHTIPGSPPDLSKPISGCPFAPRCEFAQEKCVTSTIALKEIADGHFSACLRIQLKEIDLTPGDLPENALARKVN